MNDQNKNQNFDLEEDLEENNNDYNNTSTQMTDSDDEESLGHESLTEDQDIDIDEYNENNKNPVLEEKLEDNDAESDFSKTNEDEEENDEILEEDVVKISKSKVVLIKKLLANIKDNCVSAENLLGVLVSEEDESRISISEISDDMDDENSNGDINKVIEGVFDGENMVGPDGKQYNVPPNYASKSKLVEGDLLKLAITSRGTFVYKQIKPIERDRIVGVLEKTLDGNFIVVSGSKKWKILTASVTYFKGDGGDETVILVPKVGDSKWAAVENIIKNVK